MSRLLGRLLAAGTSLLAWSAFRHDLRRARERVQGGLLLETAAGTIEYGERGQGPALLAIHGAGAGFDQGLELAAGLSEVARVLAPSRFGYLRTPLPEDGSAGAQADAHAALLDRLQIDRAVVLGASAGALSAVQFALRHPERTQALILLVPALWYPGLASTPPARSTQFLLGTALRSDFLFWSAQRCARHLLVRGILATNPALLRTANRFEQDRIERFLELLQPVSQRRTGLLHDAMLLASLQRWPLERIAAPTLLISARDDRFGTCAAAEYSATQIPGARLRVFATGGHLLVGRNTAVQAELAGFLRAHGKTG